MKDDAGASLGIWRSFKEFTSPSVGVDIDPQPQPQPQQSDVKSGLWRWRAWCQQPKHIWGVAVLLAITLILGNLALNEDMPVSSFLDRMVASFKKTETVPVSVPVSAPVPSFEGCEPPSNSTRTVEDEAARKSCYAQVSESLPRGIISATTDMQMRSLFDEDEEELQKRMAKNLLAMAVGIKQKKDVDEIVQKFPLNNFTIMLFHYDGIVDQWKDLAWSNQSIHVVAMHQTKWWYAKRFMHPDVVGQYNYIFLWDEDIGVENFNAVRYLEIMESKSLDISQPALDPASRGIHHRVTVRRPKVDFHRSAKSIKCKDGGRVVPCVGFVEVMVPVFERAAWKCVWHLIQNDLVHGWGMDYKVGYCAQGLRNERVGVIDAEYVLHKGIPSLGDSHSATNISDPREEVRKKSYGELRRFQQRWLHAASEDTTWVDPYKQYLDDALADEELAFKEAPAPAEPQT